MIQRKASKQRKIIEEENVKHPVILTLKKGLTCITFMEERFINRIHKEIPPNKQVYHI